MEREFPLDHSLRRQSVMVGKAWRQECEAAGWVMSAVERLREVCVSLLSPSDRGPNPGNVTIHMAGALFLPQISNLQAPSQTGPGDRNLGNFKSRRAANLC